MAARAYLVVNSTSADVTVNGKTAVAGRVTPLSLDDTVLADFPGWGAAGCALLRADVLDTSEHKEIGFLIERNAT